MAHKEKKPEGLGVISLAVLSLSTQVLPTEAPLLINNLILKTFPATNLISATLLLVWCVFLVFIELVLH